MGAWIANSADLMPGLGVGDVEDLDGVVCCSAQACTSASASRRSRRRRRRPRGPDRDDGLAAVVLARAGADLERLHRLLQPAASLRPRRARPRPLPPGPSRPDPQVDPTRPLGSVKRVQLALQRRQTPGHAGGVPGRPRGRARRPARRGRRDLRAHRVDVEHLLDGVHRRSQPFDLGVSPVLPRGARLRARLSHSIKVVAPQWLPSAAAAGSQLPAL